MSDFPLGSVWEADVDGSGAQSMFVVVAAAVNGERTAFLLEWAGRSQLSSSTFWFRTSWVFCERCVRVA